MKPRIYIDTSVFGGYFDEEFAEHTIPLFTRIHNDEFMVLYSTVTQEELENAPEKVQALVKSLKIANTEFIEVTEEAIEPPPLFVSHERLSVACADTRNGINLKVHFNLHSYLSTWSNLNHL